MVPSHITTKESNCLNIRHFKGIVDYENLLVCK